MTHEKVMIQMGGDHRYRGRYRSRSRNRSYSREKADCDSDCDPDTDSDTDGLCTQDLIFSCVTGCAPAHDELRPSVQKPAENPMRKRAGRAG
jgi:hypothetical protein